MTRAARAVPPDHAAPEIPTEIAVPPALALYVEAIGVAATMRLALELGGAELYIADNPGAKSRMVGVIGHEAAAALGKSLGRGSIRVPTAKPWLAQHLKAQGWTVADIARKLHVTDVTVRAYLRRGTADDRQLSLL